MLAPVDTNKRPEVAPDGIVNVIPESLQEVIVMGTPLIATTLLPSDVPKLEPLIPI